MIQMTKVYTAQKWKKEILNCIEKYRVLRTYWTPLLCLKVDFYLEWFIYSTISNAFLSSIDIVIVFIYLFCLYVYI